VSSATWGHVKELWHELQRQPTGERTELLAAIAQLPLIDERVLRTLFGLSGPASLDRRLTVLGEKGLIAWVTPSASRGRPPRLFYLTDLGITLLAYGRGVEPYQFARCYGTGRLGLHESIRRLPLWRATYDLLARLARVPGIDGEPVLLERPWRRRFATLTAKTPLTIELPCRSAFRWHAGEVFDCLLLPDLGMFAPRAYRLTMRKLMALRRSSGEVLPVLAISTTDESARAAWHRVIDDVAREQGDRPLDAMVFSPSSEAELPAEIAGRLVNDVGPSPRHSWRGCGPHRDRDVIAPLVGDPPFQTRDAVSTHLTLSSEDRGVIDVIGRYPLVLEPEVGTLSQATAEDAARRCSRLIDQGFVRRGPPPPDPDLRRSGKRRAWRTASAGTDRQFVLQLTREGFLAAAGRSALPLATIRRKILGTDGTEVQKRREWRLFAQFEHTRGIVGFFTELIHLSERRRRTGADDRLVEWQSEAFCSQRWILPDAYGVFERCGRRYGFFLEFDRGTEHPDDFERKFNAYYEYRDSGAYQRDYDGFPTILLVTTGLPAIEDRIACAARNAGIGHPAPLPLLLTTTWRLNSDTNPDGALGPVWRTATDDARRCWQRGPGGGTRTYLEVAKWV